MVQAGFLSFICIRLDSGVFNVHFCLVIILSGFGPFHVSNWLFSKGSVSVNICTKKYHFLVVCRLFKSGICSPDWLVYLCRWATWETGRLGVPGGQETFTDRRGRIIIYCNGGLARKSRVTSLSTIQHVFLLQTSLSSLQPNEVVNIHTEHTYETNIYSLLKSKFISL